MQKVVSVERIEAPPPRGGGGRGGVLLQLSVSRQLAPAEVFPAPSRCGTDRSRPQTAQRCRRGSAHPGGGFERAAPPSQYRTGPAGRMRVAILFNQDYDLDDDPGRKAREDVAH